MVGDAHTAMEAGSLVFPADSWRGFPFLCTLPVAFRRGCRSCEEAVTNCCEGPLPSLSSATGMLAEGMGLEWSCASTQMGAPLTFTKPIKYLQGVARKKREERRHVT